MESIGLDLREMQRVPLAASHVEALRRVGRERDFAAGTVIVDPGDPVDQFVYVEDGEIEVVNPFTGERYVPSTLGPTQFMGEISFLCGGSWTLQMRAARDTRVIEVPRPAMLRLMAEIPEMSDIVITVLSARRRRELESHNGMLVLLGANENVAVRRIAEFANRNRLPFASHEAGTADAMRIAGSCGADGTRPAVIFGRNTVVADPTPEKVARLLGIVRDLTEDEPIDVLIVGSGPAGVAAASMPGPRG